MSNTINLRVLIYLLLFISLSSIVFTCGEDYGLDLVFFNNSNYCEDLRYITVSDLDCEPFPPPGNCWDNYDKIELIIPQNFIVETETKLNLESDIDSYTWDSVLCQEPADFQISVMIKNDAESCEIQHNVTLDEKEVEGNILGNPGSIFVFLLIVLVVLITSLYFVLKKK